MDTKMNSHQEPNPSANDPAFVMEHVDLTRDTCMLYDLRERVPLPAIDELANYVITGSGFRYYPTRPALPFLLFDFSCLGTNLEHGAHLEIAIPNYPPVAKVVICRHHETSSAIWQHACQLFADACDGVCKTRESKPRFGRWHATFFTHAAAILTKGDQAMVWQLIADLSATFALVGGGYRPLPPKPVGLSLISYS
jgi:hypothetical protein